MLAYAEAIVWHLNTDDAFWDRMHKHFSEPELVEIGCMIGLTLGQQSWLRLLNIEHHQVLAGTDASMAPGYEDMQKLVVDQGRDADYWAKSKKAELVGEGGLTQGERGSCRESVTSNRRRSSVAVVMRGVRANGGSRIPENTQRETGRRP